VLKFNMSGATGPTLTEAGVGIVGRGLYCVGGRCVDCGFALSETSTSWPTCQPLQRELIKTPSASQGPGARGKQAFTLNGGSGTHIDSPAHFIPDGRTVDEISPNELAGIPLVVIDATEQCATNADYMCDVEDLRRDEKRFGPIIDGALVCIRTGWAAARYSHKERYYNMLDPDDIDAYIGVPRMHFPGLAPEAARFLLEERRAVGVGIDTLSPDGGGGASAGFPTHHAILGRDRYILENMHLTMELPQRGAIAFVSPLNVVGAPESPARIWAILGVDVVATPSGGS